MAEQPIRIWPDPVLMQPCAPVDLHDPALPALVADLFDTMYAANGRGLAAPQIGILCQVFVVDVTWKEGPPDPRAFINPRDITPSGAPCVMDEQCLSIPELPMPVTRPAGVSLTWDVLDGASHSGSFDGVLARCIQHEIDHLTGTVILFHQSPHDRKRLEAEYAP